MSDDRSAEACQTALLELAHSLAADSDLSGDFTQAPGPIAPKPEVAPQDQTLAFGEIHKTGLEGSPKPLPLQQNLGSNDGFVGQHFRERPGAAGHRLVQRNPAAWRATPRGPLFVAGDRLSHRTTDPEMRITDKADAPFRIKAVRRSDEAEVPLVHQVIEREASTTVPARQRHDKTKVGGDEAPPGRGIAGSATAGQIGLLLGFEQMFAGDVGQVPFEDAHGWFAWERMESR